MRRFAGWREEQDLLHRELRSHANADASTMEAGVALLELATTAVRLWEKQDATARRKILAFLSQNSTFGEEGLTVTWREPFDLLAEITATRKAGVGENSDSTAVHTEWLPVGVRAEGASAEALYTWQVSIELPPHPGFGLRRHRPAGHAKGKGKGAETASGPGVDGAGQGCGPGVETVAPDPWAGALARVRGHLERARRYRAWLEGGAERTLKELGELEGVSKARVSQLVSLLDLAPEIVADLERPNRVGPVPSELALRHIAALPDAERQVAQYRAVCAPAEAGLPRREGFQHEFARARRYQELLESGEHESLSSLGRAEGITGARVGQVLLMLHLAPEIIAALDVPLERTPEDVTMKLVREIARKRSQATQRRMFEARWPGLLSQAAAAK